RWADAQRERSDRTASAGESLPPGPAGLVVVAPDGYRRASRVDPPADRRAGDGEHRVPLQLAGLSGVLALAEASPRASQQGGHDAALAARYPVRYETA